MNFGQTALQVLKTVAPTLALAVGGPFGPLAAAAIHAALGTTDQKSAETALLNATPDQLLALKKADQDFQVRMKELDISEEKLSFDDTANARAREIATKDSTPKYMAYLITLGFFATLAYLIIYGKPQTGGDVMLVMVGALGTAWSGIVQYYFGSSAGSAAKTDAINKVIATK
jgi:hypothetical protein